MPVFFVCVNIVLHFGFAKYKLHGDCLNAWHFSFFKQTPDSTHTVCSELHLNCPSVLVNAHIYIIFIAGQQPNCT